MGLLQLEGSLKLWVSFAEYRLFYRAVLQRRPIISRSLLIVATPYQLSIAFVGCIHIDLVACIPVDLATSIHTDLINDIFMLIWSGVFIQI